MLATMDIASVETARMRAARRLRMRPAFADAYVAVAVLCVTAVGATDHLVGWVPSGALIMIGFVQGALVVARRRAPLIVLAATTAVGAFAIAIGAPGGSAAAGVYALAYAVAMYIAEPLMVVGAVAVLGSGIVLAAAAVLPESRASDSVVLWLVAFVLAIAMSWTSGYALRIRRAYVVELAERAARLEREEGERAARAVADERLRIARELHDVIGHSISLIAIQSEAAARLARTRPDTVAGFLTTISATSREALAEMRHVLAVLRPERPDELRPQPGLGALPELVDRIEAAGLPVRLDIAAPDLPAGIGLTVYRIVQEALTNVLKHAGPAQASVTVAQSGDRLHVSVRDTGLGTGHARPARALPATAHGIVGMRERVALYGGTLRVGRHLAGGFEVHATLPLTDSMTDPTTNPTTDPMTDPMTEAEIR